MPSAARVRNTSFRPASPTPKQVAAVAKAPKVAHAVPIDRSGDKVTVICKLPNGLRLQVHRVEDTDMPMMGGGFKTVPVARPDGDPITANGWRARDGGIKHGSMFGYGVTRNVPAEFWERWLEENKKQPYVVQGLIYAHGKEDHAKGFAKEHKAVLSGLEPLNPARTLKTVDGSTKSVPVDPRWPHKIKPKTEKDDDEGE